MTIGNAALPLGLLLAPMAGFTDSAFRQIAFRCGAEYAVTEMISARALVYGDRKTSELARIRPEEGPVAIQLFGSEPEILAEAAGRLLQGDVPGCPEYRLPAAIDLNMGCPVRKIVTGGDGSALMRTPEKCAAIVAAVTAVCRPAGMPVTVKIRAGWDDAHRNAVEVALATAEAGAAAVAVHGRTREQMYQLAADWNVIAAVRRALPSGIPVIGNGDVRTAEDAERMLRTTGCDGVMIGREALGNPWLFTETAARLRGQAFLPPTENRRIETALEMLRDVIALRGNEELGVRDCRGRIAHFIRGLRGSAAIRDRLNHALTYREAEEALQNRPEC